VPTECEVQSREVLRVLVEIFLSERRWIDRVEELPQFGDMHLDDFARRRNRGRPVFDPPPHRDECSATLRRNVNDNIRHVNPLTNIIRATTAMMADTIISALMTTARGTPCTPAVSPFAMHGLLPSPSLRELVPQQCRGSGAGGSLLIIAMIADGPACRCSRRCRGTTDKPSIGLAKFEHVANMEALSRVAPIALSSSQ
jgi:hypothetical protein